MCCVSLLAYKVVELLTLNKQTVSFAESLTGGMISSGIVDVSGASRCFKGGVVSYTNEVKINVLGVNPDVIDEHTEVSGECAEQMAQGVAKLTNTDISISVTGIAGPNGDLPGKPVGTVFMGYYAFGKSGYVRLQLTGDREKIRIATCEAAYRKILELAGFTND